jgi:hypothetical protein
MDVLEIPELFNQVLFDQIFSSVIDLAQNIQMNSGYVVPHD